MAKPIVAIVGRPNVGKSQLFNRLAGKRLSIVEDTPGVTRDRLYADSDWRGRDFTVIDTGGIEPSNDNEILQFMRFQAETAISHADVIILITDLRTGITAADQDVASMLLRSGKPLVLAVNKCDKPGAMSFDPDILLTSAKTGYGLDTLLQKLDELLADRVHTLKVLLPYDKLGLAAPMRERGSVQVEEYREDGLYLEGIVKTEDLHCFEGYLV